MNLPTDWQAQLYALRVWLLERKAAVQPRTVLVGAGGAVAVTALILGVLVPQWLDGRSQGRALAIQLASVTGMRVQIEGDVKVAILPTPHMSIHQLRFMSVDGRNTYMKVGKLDLDVTLGSLMAGSFVIESATVSKAELFAGSHQLSLGQLLDKGSLLSQLGVSSIAVEHSSMNVSGLARSEAVTDINGQIVLPNSSTLLQTELQAQWRGAPVRLRADLSTPFGKQSSLAQAELDVGAAELNARVNGMLDTLRPGFPSELQIEVKAGQASSAWALLSSLGLASPAWGDKALQHPLQLSAQLKSNGEDFDFSNLHVRLGETQVKGLARFVTGADGGVSLALGTGRLNLAQWPSLTGLVQAGDVVIPPRWLAAFDLNAAEVVAGQAKLTGANLKGEIKNGTVSFNNISATLAGDTRLLAKGSVATRKGAAATLDGQVSLESLQLRELLSAMAVPVPASLSDNALRQFKVSSDVRGTWNNFGFSGLSATLDGSTITGQISPRRNDGTFAAMLAVSQLDLAAVGNFATLPTWVWQLPPLSLDVRFDRLSLAGQSANNVSVQAELTGKLLRLKQVDAVDFGGNKIRLAGTLSPDARQDVDLTVRLITPDYAALGRTLPAAGNLVPPLLAGWFEGNTDLSVRVRRQNGETQQLTSASFTGGKMDVVVTTRADTPVVWKARVQSRETAGVLARLVSGALSRQDAVLGPFDLYAEGVAVDDNRWQIRAIQGQLAGAVLRDGELSVATAGAYKVDGRLVLDTVNLDLWKQVLNVPTVSQSVSGSVLVQSDRVMIAGTDLADVSANLNLGAGGEFAISRLQSKWRDGALTGTLEGRLSAPYRIKGALTVAESNVNLTGSDRFGVDGVLDLSLRAEGEGASWDAVVRNLQGDGEFSLDSGSVSGIDFAALTEALLDKRTTPDVVALLERSGQSSLSSLGGDFNIEDGRLRAPRVRLRTPAASAELNATAELATRRVDAVAEISLRELASAPPVKLQLGGVVGELNGRFNSTDLAAFVNKGQPARTTAVADAKDSKDKAAGKDKDKAGATETAAANDTSGEDVALRSPDMPEPPAARNRQADDVKAAEAPRRGTVLSSRASKAPKADEPSAVASAAPARKAAAPAASGNPNAPPSIQALLDAMPALQSAATIAVDEERRAAQIAPAAGGGKPKVDFAPATARAPRLNGLAPEFAGMAPKPAKDVNSAEVYAQPISPSGFDVISSDDEGAMPPASVSELLQRTNR